MPSVSHPLPTRVLLVDDQRAILVGLGALIDSEAPRMRVVGQADCARRALELAGATQPDLIVLDADLAGDDGLALICPLRAACHAVIVVFTCLTDPQLQRRALRLGATDFVSKTASGEELLAALRGAARCGAAYP